MPVIYTLTCPLKNTVFYIGKTQGDLKTRLRSHISSNNKNKVNKIINQITSFDLIPIIEEIDSAGQKDISLLEAYWISQFRSWGFVLCNENLNKFVYPKNFTKGKFKRKHKN